MCFPAQWKIVEPYIQCVNGINAVKMKKRWKKNGFIIEQLLYFHSVICKNCDHKPFFPHVPMLWNTPGLQWQYRWANASIMRSIFWASPGSLKLHRNCLRAWTRFKSVNSWSSRKACRTLMLNSSLHDTRNPTHKHTPTCARTQE